MEGVVFHYPAVRRELVSSYVEGRLHTDEPELAKIKLERNDGNQTLPTYEIVDPANGETLSRFLGADPDALGGSNFAKFLRDGVEKARKARKARAASPR